MLQGSRRNQPNILVIGTPGTGKTTTSSALAESTQLRHINIEDFVREKNLHDGWDDELKCHIINEDLPTRRYLVKIVTRMLIKSLLSSDLPLRCFSSFEPHVLRTGDILRQTRSPVNIGGEVLGGVQALNVGLTNRRYLEKFLTKCVRNGELLVLDGEAMTILPTLAVEQVQSMAYRS